MNQIVNKDESLSETSEKPGAGRVLSCSGPLPPASEFERYEKAVPGSGMKIIEMAEKQSAHRHKIESRTV